MGLIDLAVHYSDVHTQPEIHILCDDSWTMPSSGHITLIQRSLQRREIYKGEDERYYTFDEKKVTCKACLSKMKPKAA